MFEFDLHNILFLTLLFEFRSERTGPSSQKAPSAGIFSVGNKGGRKQTAHEKASEAEGRQEFNSCRFLVRTFASVDTTCTEEPGEVAHPLEALCYAGPILFTLRHNSSLTPPRWVISDRAPAFPRQKPGDAAMSASSWTRSLLCWRCFPGDEWPIVARTNLCRPRSE